MIRVMIGYDPNEIVAYQILCHSILSRSSEPVSITAININSIKGYTRERDPLQSTEFSFSRFLVPWLCGYKGRAIFLDCDMLVLDDIAKLWYAPTPINSPVAVVKHEYVPATKTKFLGQVQSPYPKKNWSSVMLFNCEHPDCKNLTPEAVNTKSGKWLHQFGWVMPNIHDEDPVGELSPKWNYLVGEEQPTVPGREVEKPSLVHWTLGGPYFKEYYDCEYAAEWLREKYIADYATQESESEERDLSNVRGEGDSEAGIKANSDSQPTTGEAQ